MKYEVKNNEIIIPKCADFDIKQRLECGQVFRFKQTDFGYEVYSLNHKASIYCQQMHTIIKCDDVNYFINYFDLLTDYARYPHLMFVKNSLFAFRKFYMSKERKIALLVDVDNVKVSKEAMDELLENLNQKGEVNFSRRF